MQICVCGWHYYKEFYETLFALRERHNIVIIAHKEGDTAGLPCIRRENIGLEWGAYSYFLEHCWDKKTEVLFMHDDTLLTIEFLNELSAVTDDLVFVFENEQEFQESLSHGRAFYASERFLKILQSRGGIWYDSGNKGFIAKGRSWSEKPPEGCLDHNAGIRRFTSQAQEIGKQYPHFSVNKPLFSQNIRCGKRGTFQHYYESH